MVMHTGKHANTTHNSFLNIHTYTTIAHIWDIVSDQVKYEADHQFVTDDLLVIISSVTYSTCSDNVKKKCKGFFGKIASD